MIEAGLIDFQLGEYIRFVEFLIGLFVCAVAIFVIAKIRSKK